MKFALVEWVNNNSTSIILSTGIRNKTMLSDTTLVDKVEFVRESKVPSTGWPAYDAKVLAVSDNKSDLKQLERKWLEEDDQSSLENNSDCEAGRGKRKKVAKTLAHGKEKLKADCIARNTVTQVAKKKNKLLKTARQVESSQILDSIADQSVAVNENVKDTVPEDKVNVMELKVQVNQLTEIENSLKAENEELKLEVIQLKEIIGCLQTGLPNIVTQLKDALGSFPPVTRKPVLTSTSASTVCGSKPSYSSLAPTPDPPATCTIPHSPEFDEARVLKTPKTTGAASNQRASCTLFSRNQSTSSLPAIAAEPEADPMPCVDAKSSLEKLLAPKMPFIRKDDYRKTTRDLMEVLFTTEEMATSSVTGGKGHSGSSKGALDQNKISFIISKVCQHFPGTNVQLIRTTMTNKVQDVAKMCKRKNANDTSNTTATSADCDTDNGME